MCSSIIRCLFCFGMSVLLLSASSVTVMGEEAGYWQQKARIAFADTRYLETAYFARKALTINPDDPAMSVLLARAHHKMHAGPQHISALYQKALRLAPDNPDLLAYAAAFYLQTGNLAYASKLEARFIKACKYNCGQYWHIIKKPKASHQ